MDTEFLVRFLAWSLALNYGLLLTWFLSFAVARDWMRGFHGRWFRLSDGSFDAIQYGGMAAYKLAIFFFNLVPLCALLLMGRGAAP